MEERRVVTVLFCDIVGSTALASDADAEDWAEVVRTVFPLMIDPVGRHGGTVARLMGDAVLAFFGAPISREDDPQRAILAALEIQHGVADAREGLRRTYGFGIDVRVGINTGIVVTGEFGSDIAREYTALGDTVNVAARMEQTAKPGTIQITAATYRLALPYFNFQPLGLVEVKGKPGGVESYRVLGRVTAPGHRGLQDFAGPLVGRERELGLLRYRLGELDAGRGGITALIAEAGLGKSRLVAELRRLWLSEQGHGDDTWTEDQLVSFEETMPYGLVHRRLARDLAVEDGVAVPTLRDQLDNVLLGLGAEDRVHAVRAVGHLFGSEPETSDLSDSSGIENVEDFRQELALVLEHIWRSRIDSFGNCVYVIEDFHCIDASSVDLFESLVANLLDLPLLIILTFRPEREAPFWAVHERLASRLGVQYLSLSLAPLPWQDSRALIDAMLPGTNFPDSFRQVILERIDGNPLFAGEIVRSLIERGLVRPVLEAEQSGWTVAADLDIAAVEIPASLQALVQERVDMLDAGTKRTLQLASIIGRSFEYDELLEVIGDPATLDLHLTTLQHAMLVRPDDYGGAGSYAFFHALIWEAVYRSMLRRTLEQLHCRVGEALERLHGSRRDEHAGVLAQHFAVAGDARAVLYAETAGLQAQMMFAPQEALEHFTRALRAAEAVGQTPPARLFRQRGRANEIRGNVDAARIDFAAALDLARSGGDLREEWETIVDIGRSWEGFDYDRSGEWFKRALDLARRLDDPKLLGHSLNRVGTWYVNIERLDDARAAHLEALEIFEDLDDEPGIAATSDYLGMAALMSGDLDDMRNGFGRAAEMFERMGDLQGLSSTLASMAFLSGSFAVVTVSTSAASSPTEAESWGLRGLQLAQEIGWRSGEAFARMNLGGLYIAAARYDDAFRSLHEGIRISTEIAHREWLTGNTALLGLLLCEILASDRAVETLDQSTDFARESGSRYWVNLNTGFLLHALVESGLIDRASQILGTFASDFPMQTSGQFRIWLGRATWLLATGNAESSLEILDRLFVAGPHCGSQEDMPLIAWRRGLALVELDRVVEGEEALLAAEKRARHLGWLGKVWHMQLDLARLYRSLGREEEAAAVVRSAREIVDQLAPRIPDDEGLRANFLASSQAMFDAVPKRTNLPA